MNAIDDTDQVYLASDAKLEPLVFRWHAWGHLVSPVQLALSLAFRQLPMLRSFIANPAVHEMALKNPKMMGGSFLELKQRDVAAVRALLQETLQRGTALLAFADTLIKFDRLLQGETGFSLDHIYASLPPALAGLIEVSYDLNHHPTLRVFEELIDADELARAPAQEIGFSRGLDDIRDFFLNTPRLETEERMIVPLAFGSPHFDLLAASRITPMPFDAIAKALGFDGDAAGRERLRTYFDAAPPHRNEPEYAGAGVRVRYFGHACMLVQSAEVSVLIDPFLTWDRTGQDRSERLTFHDLPDRIDYVFLTHNHQDHFSVEAMLQLRNRVGTLLVPRHNPHSLADPSMKLALHRLGFNNVRTMDPMDQIDLPNGLLRSLPFYGEHADLNIDSKQGLCLQLNGHTLLFLADSDAKDPVLYQRLARLIGPVSHLFIGMECDGAPLSWLYGPYLSSPISRKDDESRRLSGSDSEHAWSIVEAFRCGTAYVYAMGQEPWLRFVAGLQYTPQSKQIVESDKFVARCRAAGLASERLCGSRTFLL